MEHLRHLSIVLPILALQVSPAGPAIAEQPSIGQRTISETTYVLQNKGRQSCTTNFTFDDLGKWTLETTYFNSKRKFGERVRAVLTLTASDGSKSVAVGQEGGMAPVPYCGEDCKEVVTHTGRLNELAALHSASVDYVCMNIEHRMSFFFPAAADIVVSCKQFEPECERVEDHGNQTNLIHNDEK